MGSDPEIEQTFSSTSFVWKRVKISQSPEGHKAARRSRSAFLRLTRQPRSKVVRLTVTYRGGAESWWCIEARGCRQHFAGVAALEDVMARVLSER